MNTVLLFRIEEISIYKLNTKKIEEGIDIDLRLDQLQQQ